MGEGRNFHAFFISINLNELLTAEFWEFRRHNVKRTMNRYLKSIKSVLLLALFLSLPLEVYSQITMDELLNSYLTASVKNENNVPYITKISQLFKSYNESEQDAFRQSVYDRIICDTTIDSKAYIKKIALIDLYTILANDSDSKIDDLYFQKGEICGLHTGDTIMLKECITGLRLSDHSKTPKVDGYISQLQDYLEQIRNILPVSQSIDGVWVSVLSSTPQNKPYSGYFGETPFYVLLINDGQAKLDLIGYAELMTDINNSGKIKSDKQTYAQCVMDDGNKVYIAWSNEKLKIPNQNVVGTMAQVSGEATSSILSNEVGSLVGNIGGDLVGGIASGFVSGLIMELFAPSKKIYILEITLERINQFELAGNVCRQIIKVS